MNKKSYSDSNLKLKELINRELTEAKASKKNKSLKRPKAAVTAGQKT